MSALASSVIQSVDWTAVAPPVIPAVSAIVVLVADLFADARRRPLLGWLTMGGLALSLLSLLPLLGSGKDTSTFCLTTASRECGYVADHFALAVQLLVLGGALLTALLSVRTTEELPAGEYWFLLLSSAAGGALLPACRDLATLIVALEVTTLPSFALVGLRRGRLSAEAALKFFLSSVAATAVSLLGISFVYAVTGSLHFGAVAGGLAHADPRLAVLAKAGVALTLVGFAFKLAVAPFHFWVPDTYVGAPLPIAAYLSVVGKTAGFSGLILVTVAAFRPYADVWGPAVAVLAALTMTVGNVAALRQRPDAPHSVVRLLAWSSIGQAGYLMVPLAAAGAGARSVAGPVGATIAYALMYGVVNLGAFAVAAVVARTAPEGRLADHRGLHATRPLAALSLAFFLLCLAGLPPGVIGLFAKVAVFSTAVDAGQGWLAAVMAVNVVIALAYYLRWTALLFAPPRQPEPAEDTDGAEGAGAGQAQEAGVAGPAPAAGQARVPAALAAAIAVPAVIGIVLSAAPQLVLRFAAAALL